MPTIPIYKYTSYGNNFVVIDESQACIMTEPVKSSFAYQATNVNFGVGADNFLVIQPCTAEVLTEINAYRNYWKEIPDPDQADLIFRMFESDGTEAYSCGNGLMSIANHLHHYHSIEEAKIITEIPTSKPRVVTIGTDISEENNWVIMVPPRRVPDNMVSPSIRESITTCIDRIDNISIDKVRKSDAIRFFCNQSALTLCGYLVFTGEPHLVIFSDAGFDIPEIESQLFLSSLPHNTNNPVNEKRTSSSLALVDFIGKYFVREFSDQFPVGINLNFVKVAADGESFEHRCFERGINHETLACGTGSLASAFAAKALNKVSTDRIAVRPHRCRWTLPDAEITIEKHPDGWRIKGSPFRLFSGTFNLNQ